MHSASVAPYVDVFEIGDEVMFNNKYLGKIINKIDNTVPIHIKYHVALKKT
jgi:hypothetical protein